MAWQGTLADSLLVELALDRLLNRFQRLNMNMNSHDWRSFHRYLLLSLRANRDPLDSVDKARQILQVVCIFIFIFEVSPQSVFFTGAASLVAETREQRACQAWHALQVGAAGREWARHAKVKPFFSLGVLADSVYIAQLLSSWYSSYSIVNSFCVTIYFIVENREKQLVSISEF